MDSFLDKLICSLRFRKVVKHISNNSIVCDIGCGASAKFLKSISPFIKQGIGIDKEAMASKSSNIEIKKLKVSETIPLSSAAVDIVTMLAVLEHLENPAAILKECFRILKNKGKLILTTPTPRAKPVLEFLAFRLHLISEEQIKEHKNYFLPFLLKQMLFHAGFSQEKIKIKCFELGLNSLTIAEK